jgi:hypothetical protein
MKKIDLPQTIAVLANIGVITSIVFLGIAVSQNNRLLASQTSVALMTFRVNVNQRYADDREMMELRVKANRNEQLSEVEELRLLQDARSVFAYWEWEVDSYQKGDLKELPLGAFRGAMAQYAHLRNVWQISKDLYTPEFVAFMDRNVTNP